MLKNLVGNFSIFKVELYKNNTSIVWYKAAALGSIWASFEIVLGSFLHNIRFPLSGTLLTSMTVILLITFAQLWSDKGLFIKAGLIAALMKSISPSAILLGPMTAMFLEALLIEIALFFLGRNFFSYIFAGILALYSVIIHKIATLLILYGLDIVKITKNLYFFTIKQLNIVNLGFYEAIFILSLAYIGLGIIAAVIGYYTGKMAKKSTEKTDELFFKGFKNDFLQVSSNQKFSIYYLLVHIIAIIGIFAVINFLNLAISFVVGFIYLSFSAFRYKTTFRHFKKISFWIQILIILIVSILFYSGVQNISLFNEDGLIAGFSMVLRMFVLVVGFASISVELRNPFVRTILFRNGFGNLYHSLGLAFSVLPAIMEQTTNPKELIKNPRKTVVSMVQNANFIYERFIENIEQRKVIVITGERGSGKSTYLTELSKKLVEKNISVGGFIAKGHIKEGERSGFSIVDIHSHKEMILSSIDDIGKIKTGKFYFNEGALDFGKEITSKEYIKNDKFVIIDEIGPLELKNQGWSEVVEHIFESPNQIQIWAVRKNLIKTVLRRFAISEAQILDINQEDINACVNALALLR